MMTLALLPVIVQVVIMLVNGNIGTGVAVMGAFNGRFRSYQGCNGHFVLYSFQWRLVLRQAGPLSVGSLMLCCVREPAEQYLHASAYWQKEVGSQGS